MLKLAIAMHDALMLVPFPHTIGRLLVRLNHLIQYHDTVASKCVLNMVSGWAHQETFCYAIIDK